jgi:hypothetical protein
VEQVLKPLDQFVHACEVLTDARVQQLVQIKDDYVIGDVQKQTFLGGCD